MVLYWGFFCLFFFLSLFSLLTCQTSCRSFFTNHVPNIRSLLCHHCASYLPVQRTVCPSFACVTMESLIEFLSKSQFCIYFWICDAHDVSYYVGFKPQEYNWWYRKYRTVLCSVVLALNLCSLLAFLFVCFLVCLIFFFFPDVRGCSKNLLIIITFWQELEVPQCTTLRGGR